LQEQQWNETFARYKEAYPTEWQELTDRFEDRLDDAKLSDMPTFVGGSDTDNKATRWYSSKCLDSLIKNFPQIMGGSADLTPSNLTCQGGITDYQSGSEAGRYIRFGVREHAMAALANGMSSYGGFIPYVATFLNFIGYAWGSARLSALSKFGVIYVATHDSIELGEDGPTHQPVEILPMLRSTPNLLLMRPCDGNETAGCYRMAMVNRTRPSVLCLSRGGVPVQEGSSAEIVEKGAYILCDYAHNGCKKLQLLATGTEIKICVEAKKILAEEGIDVCIVSMPCWELFEEQTEEYRNSVIDRSVPRISVEASSVFGWERYATKHIGMTTFGASAPGKTLMEYFGFTAANVVEKAKEAF